MKIKILKIYEQNGVLRIETECDFGQDKIGLSPDAKYLDPITNQPKYLKQVKKLLEAKYLQKEAIPKDIDKKNWNKEIDLSKI